MKKKMCLAIALSVVIMLMAIAPVLASPAEKVSFTATQRPVPSSEQPSSPDLVLFTTEGGTIHVRNLNGAGTIVGSIPELASGTTSSEIMVERHVSGTGDLGMVKFEMTWTFGDNSFEGNIIGKVIGQNAYSTLHGVLQGTNDYKGYTIILDGTKPTAPSPFEWTGTLIMP